MTPTTEPTRMTAGDTLDAAQTATKDCQITWPVTGIRVKQTAGAGSSAITVLQAGI